MKKRHTLKSPSLARLASLLAGLLIVLTACSEDPALSGADNPYLAAEDGFWSETNAGLELQARLEGDPYLSDLPWRSAKNGWGPVEKDQSNGERAAGDGRALTLNGQTFDKGLGVHANSELVYLLDGQCSRFSAKVGLDDEIDRNPNAYGTVVFRVFADGKEVFNSGVMRGNSKTKSLNVSVDGVKELRLVVGTAEKKGVRGYNWFDHADWADAKLSCGDAPGPKPGTFNGYHVQAVYVVPKNAPQRNRSALMLEATQRIQSQWAGWGWTFALKPDIVVLNLPNTCEYYSGNTTWRRTNPDFTAAMKRRGLFNPKAKYVQFIECVRDNSAAAWGGGNQASLLDGVVNNIHINDGSARNRSSIGAIGHELGHTFGLPHENCKGNNPSNKRPPSNGPMCNGKGNWPNVSPAPYQRDLLRKNGCNWMAECTRTASQQGVGSQAVTHEHVDDDATFVDDDGNIIWRD